MRYPYPVAGGLSQPQRAAGQPLPFTTEKTPGLGSNPGFQIVRRPCYHGATARTGLDLTYECFSRGQLYVGMSRAMDPSKLYVVADENGETKSVVYTQVLYSIFLMNSMLMYGMLWYFNISRIPYHITGLLFFLHIFKS